MRWKPDGESSEYQCCLCCHVRTGTIFFGIVCLLMQIMMLSMFAVCILHPELIKQEQGRLQIQLNGHNVIQAASSSLSSSEEDDTDDMMMKKMDQEFFDDSNVSIDTRTTPYHSWDNSTSEDKFVSLLLVMAVFFATILLVYGAAKGIPGYLMPFFCIQVFFFCISCLTILSYFSSAPNIKKIIAAQDDIPYKEELLQMDNDLLTLVAVIFSVLVLSIKAYFIGMIWSCYKYLTALQRGNATINRSYPTHSNGEDGEQMLLPPKYEDAVRMTVEYPAHPPPPYMN